MKVCPTHPSIATNANTCACIALILTQAATLGAPLAVGHLEQRHAAQLVNLPKRHSRHIQSAHKMHPLSHIGFLENASGIRAQLANGVLVARLAGLAKPGGGWRQ